MSDATCPVVGLSVCVIVPATGARAHLTVRVREFLPRADFFQSDAVEGDMHGVSEMLLRLERVFFPYPHAPTAAQDLSSLPQNLGTYDVILDLRGGEPNAGMNRSARFGVWYIGGFDARHVLRGHPGVLLLLLRCCDEVSAPRCIAQMTVQTKVLLGRSHAFALEKMVQLIRHELARLAVSGAVSDCGPPPAPPVPATIADLPGYTLRVVRELAQRVGAKFGLRQDPAFGLRVGTGRVEDFDPSTADDVAFATRGYRADPFVLRHGEALVCFYEDFPPDADHAHIGAARWQGDRFQEIGPVLKTGCHLSYPFVFAHGDEVFMLPESIATGRLEVWRATDFPTDWALHATALAGLRLADPVLFEHDGQWWLAGSPSHDSIGDFSSELWLFLADGPALSSLKPHPLNPVVVGSDVARGGGRILEENGRLYRISQDNSGGGYGYGINVMEITELSAVEFRERPVRHLAPEGIPGAIGMHHVDFFEGKFVTDVRWPKRR